MPLALAIAALSGFIALSYEILWYRVLSTMTRGTSATFGLLLGAYLFGLAIGSRASGRFCTGAGGDRRHLRVLGWFVAIANAVAAMVTPVFAWSARFTDYRLGLLVVALGAGFLGAVLPLVSHFGIKPDDRAGTRLSYIYLANIVGSSAGSLLTGFVLMDRFPISGIGMILVVAGFALAAFLFAMSDGKKLVPYVVIAATTVAGILAIPKLYDRLYERLIYKNEFDGTQRFAQVVENRSGVITITQDGSVYGGGGYDGVLNTDLLQNDRNGIVRAYIVGALHPSPKNVLVVGLSAGAWTEVIVRLPGVEHLTAIEINPGYLEVVAAHPEVESLLTNPKIEFVIDDGRRWLHRHPEKHFDVIVMNTTMHWRGHATNVLSSEFQQLARQHLAPGGVFYFNTTDSLDVQLTAAKLFPYVYRISNFIAASDSPFAFDRDRWRTILEANVDEKTHPVAFAELLRYNDIAPRWAILQFYESLAGDVTDDNMRVEWKEPLRYPKLD